MNRLLVAHDTTVDAKEGKSSDNCVIIYDNQDDREAEK